MQRRKAPSAWALHDSGAAVLTARGVTVAEESGGQKRAEGRRHRVVRDFMPEPGRPSWHCAAAVWALPWHDQVSKRNPIAPWLTKRLPPQSFPGRSPEFPRKPQETLPQANVKENGRAAISTVWRNVIGGRAAQPRSITATVPTRVLSRARAPRGKGSAPAKRAESRSSAGTW